MITPVVALKNHNPLLQCEHSNVCCLYDMPFVTEASFTTNLLCYVKQSHDHTSRILHKTLATRSFSETKRECYRTNSWVSVISVPCGLSHMQLMSHHATNRMQFDCDTILHKTHCTKLLSKTLSLAWTHRQWNAILQNAASQRALKQKWEDIN